MDDLKLIKKYYGENMMHLCRELFPTILETPGLLFKLIDDSFAHSKFLYDDIAEDYLQNDFKNFIYNLVETENQEKPFRKETPFELLKEAGYNLYECKKEKDIQSFKNYYAKGEKLCSFKGGRLKSCYVFFAVKENVDEIKRENFKEPERQDEYGTSVISIQFSRGKTNTLSIKNRYNHTVRQCDATFSNNLENIIKGLTKSFERHYKLNINQNKNGSDEFEIPNYVLANDGKFYKYNYEINNIYYCPDNIIIDNFEVKKIEKEKYIVADYFIIDLVNKEIKLYDDKIKDSFIEGLQYIDKIEVARDKENGGKNINITFKNDEKAFIKLDKYNRLLGYINNNIKAVGWGFLKENRSLKFIEMNNLFYADDAFLRDNWDIEYLCFPNLLRTGTNFLYLNTTIKKADFPNLTKVGGRFMSNCKLLNEINAPKLREVGNEFLSKNDMLIVADFPELVIVKDGFLFNNQLLEILNFPKVRQFGNECLMKNGRIRELYLPELVRIGNNFMIFNSICESVYMPKLIKKGIQVLPRIDFSNYEHKVKELKKAN